MKAFRGEILSVPDDPAVAGAGAIRHFEDGLLVVEDGLVLACGRHAELADKFAEVPTERLNGLIGSRTKRARFLSRLEKDGVDHSRLTCPIGLPGVHGKEPEVIAIATLAQLLMLRSPA